MLGVDMTYSRSSCCGSCAGREGAADLRTSIDLSYTWLSSTGYRDNRHGDVYGYTMLYAAHIYTRPHSSRSSGWTQRGKL